MRWMRLSLIILYSLCISCLDNQQTNVVASVPCDTLRIIDSIGVMYGDSNYVFGSITDIARDQLDNIYVLDRKRNCILVYSPMGEFIQQIGRYGEGPGEFNDPSQIVITGDGSINVVNNQLWCRFIRDCTFLDGQYLDNQSIMHMGSFGYDSIVGIVNILSLSNEGMSVDRRIAMWDVQDPNYYHTIFYQREHTANVPDDIFTIDLYHYVSFTVLDSLIFIAPDPLTDPLIYSYAADGTPQDTLILDYSVVPKTEDDIAEEKSYIENSLYAATSGERSVDWQPYPNRAMIGELGSDSLGRLWVQRVNENIASFDIVDPYGLEVIETIVIPEIDDVMNWEFHISEYGVLGIQRYVFDYPAVYIIGKGQEE